jgi:hypothetical protein
VLIEVRHKFGNLSETSGRQSEQMNTKTKFNLAASAAALLATGFLCQTAKAQDPYLNVTEWATLKQDSNPDLLVGVGSIAEPYGGGYEYYYAFFNAPVDLTELSILGTTPGISSPLGGTSVNITPGVVTWTFGATETISGFEFFSPYAPTLGDAEGVGADGQSWGPDYGIVVPDPPSVPDGGLTISLLSGALLGLGSLRRKIGC